ncbi:hypothetical protein C2E23DRAFT_860352 [Lenzites betulinus]|nr:hypothetical protein C2E23DRAFT_860352 [Lenzites betulinus]
MCSNDPLIDLALLRGTRDIRDPLRGSPPGYGLANEYLADPQPVAVEIFSSTFPAPHVPAQALNITVQETVSRPRTSNRAPSLPGPARTLAAPLPSLGADTTQTYKSRGRVVKLAGVMLRPPTPEPRLTSDGTWILECPVRRDLCGFVQHNKRVVDMKRHLDAHFPVKCYRCVGRPVDQVDEAVFRALPKKLEKIRIVGDEAYVGGCGKTFDTGRKDSFQRHVKSGPCLSGSQDVGVLVEDGDDLDSV